MCVCVCIYIYIYIYDISRLRVNHIWSLQTYYHKKAHRQGLRKTLQWEPCWYMQTDRQQERHDDANTRFLMITRMRLSKHKWCGVNFTFMGPCIVSIFQYISNKMQRYTVLLYLETAPHVSDGTSAHHQERIQLYLQHLLFVRPLLLPAAIAAGSR